MTLIVSRFGTLIPEYVYSKRPRVSLNPMVSNSWFSWTRNKNLLLFRPRIMSSSGHYWIATILRSANNWLDMLMMFCLLNLSDRKNSIWWWPAIHPTSRSMTFSTNNCLILAGHEDIVLCIDVFASNSNMFASSSKDNTVRIWLFDPIEFTATCLYKGSGHSRSVTSIAVPYKSCKWIVSGSVDTVIKVWQMSTDESESESSATKILNTISSMKAHEKDINSLAIAPNDLLIASGSQDKTAKLWSINSNFQLAHVGTFSGHRRGIWCLKFSPVDQVLCTSSADMSVKIWSLSDMSCLKTFEGHECSVLNVCFISRGTQIVSSGSDGNVKIWSVKKNECQATIDAHDDKVWTLCMSKKEEIMVTGAADSRIILWKDVTEAETLQDQEKRDLMVQEEQTLLNLIHKKKWSKSLRIALKLDQPFRCLNILNEILLLDGGLSHDLNDDGIEADRNMLYKTMARLREDQLIQLLKYSMKWNTNSKNCLTAQAVINCVFRLMPPESLLEHPDIKEMVTGLLPYTEKHLNRIQKLQQQIMIIDMVFNSMRIKQDVNENI